LLTDTDYHAHADFRYALRRFLRVSEENARAVGITPQQHALLLVVRGHPSYPAVNITEIAEHLQVRHHSASLLVDRAIGRGLLRREQDTTDRRRSLISLTPEGEAKLEQVTLANRRVLADIKRTLANLRDSLQPLDDLASPDGRHAAPGAGTRPSDAVHT